MLSELTKWILAFLQDLMLAQMQFCKRMVGYINSNWCMISLEIRCVQVFQGQIVSIEENVASIWS